MYFASFYQHPVNHGQLDLSPIEACGDRSVIILDGRNTIPTMHDIAERVARKRGYVGFTISRGDSFTRAAVIRKLHLLKT